MKSRGFNGTTCIKPENSKYLAKNKNSKRSEHPSLNSFIDSGGCGVGQVTAATVILEKHVD